MVHGMEVELSVKPSVAAGVLVSAFNSIFLVTFFYLHLTLLPQLVQISPLLWGLDP